MVDIGTKAKLLFNDVDFLPSEKQEKFRKDCQEFYKCSVEYLQKQLPLDNPVIKHAQYLHPIKRNDPSSCTAISNLALKVAESLKNRLSEVFMVKSSNATVEGICDLVRSQWKVYQVEDICGETYLEAKQGKISSRVQLSYWDYALEICNMKRLPKRTSTYIKVDEYWSK